jgi:hypothetical protein
MATYTELRTLFNDATLKDKVSVACIIAAEAIRTESDQTVNHANRLKWAKKVFTDTDGQADDMLKALLAANNTAALATINSASDATIQTAVNAAVNVFADGS